MNNNKAFSIISLKLSKNEHLIAVRTLEKGILSWDELRSEILIYRNIFKMIIEGKEYIFKVNPDTMDLEEPKKEILLKADKY